VHYSGAKNLDFSCEKQNGELWVVLADDGIPFDPTAAAAEEKEFDMLDRGGMGAEHHPADCFFFSLPA
jgi:signal transduction histidine kinase